MFQVELKQFQGRPLHGIFYLFPEERCKRRVFIQMKNFFLSALAIKLIASVGGRKFVVTTVRINDDTHVDDDVPWRHSHSAWDNKRLMPINGL